MGTNARQTAVEIEETREELARKVDELVDRAKVEAQEAGKKMALGFGMLILLLLIGFIAKRRVQS